MASSWERLANVTLGSDGSTLSSGTFTAKKHLRVVAWVNGNGSSSVGNLNMRLGNGTVDTGSNYGHIYSANGSSGVTQTSQTAIRVHDDAGNDNAGYFMEMVISNIASNEKLVQVHSIQVGSTGAGTAPIRGEVVGKWANTSDQINVISLIAGTSFLAGSVITVWGADDDVVSYTYPNLSNGAIYEESDTGKHYMFDGTSAWNEIT